MSKSHNTAVSTRFKELHQSSSIKVTNKGSVVTFRIAASPQSRTQSTDGIFFSKLSPWTEIILEELLPCFPNLAKRLGLNRFRRRTSFANQTLTLGIRYSAGKVFFILHGFDLFRHIDAKFLHGLCPFQIRRELFHPDHTAVVAQFAVWHRNLAGKFYWS